MKVKICGVRTKENALTAVEAGADFLGFNFVKISKRYVDPAVAQEIISVIQGKAKIVGVFQNAEVDYINKIAQDLKLDYVQLHGDEDMEVISKLFTPVIKSVGVANSQTVEEIMSMLKTFTVDYFLLDRLKQGEGEMIDAEKAFIIAGEFPSFLAGGLTPENVEELVKQVKPFGVDVAGGIETNGEQDPEKVRLFIQNAKGVQI